MGQPVSTKPALIVIDNDPESLRSITDGLAKSEFTVCPCTDPKQALRYVERQPARWQPGMFMIDLILPELGGFELLRRLTMKYDPRAIPFVMMSKHDSPEDAMEAQQDGAIGMLKKPVSFESFNRLLEEHRLKKLKAQVGSMAFKIDTY